MRKSFYEMLRFILSLAKDHYLYVGISTVQNFFNIKTVSKSLSSISSKSEFNRDFLVLPSRLLQIV